MKPLDGPPQIGTAPPQPGTAGTGSATGISEVEVLTEKPGDTIGRFKLLARLGHGGCGAVYLAEQSEPVHRRVALKIIKLGMDTREVVARFEAERQALALMDHPHIAKVFDAGATETGRPYFVMELVRGLRITDYCDQHRLATNDRLKLFVQVCRAIQHAHQKGIIHRDIKPSNVLVTAADEAPAPKVIDFGISKATSQQLLTDKTIFTACDQFIGTPAYMSPEQADMGAVDIDTRTDIYSLGVLLYELLTGRPPFDPETLLAGGLDNMRKLIREADPPRPSTRLTTLSREDLGAVASRRHTDPPRLISTLRGDLDWIVMKALEKDRNRRYEAANSLASDIQRYLNNEAVSARPPSRFYRLRKLIQRHRLMAGAGSVVAIVMVAATVVSIWQAQRATDARDAERQLRFVAERTAADLFRSRAELFARRGNWADAEADLANGVAIDPSRLWDWFRLAPLMLHRGDSKAYQALCDGMLARFQNSVEPTDIERLAKACLLGPSRPEQLSAATQLAQRAVETGKRSPYLPYFLVTRALADYRNGRFAEAEAGIDQALGFTDLDPNVHALAYTLRAMAEFRLGRADEAKANLAKGIELAKEPVPLDVGPDAWKKDYWPDWWHDWIIIQLFLREAREMVEGAPAALP